ncbi:MAG: DUF4012 domain-containing protein [Candidatus Shapirobacteria bacterium]
MPKKPLIRVDVSWQTPKILFLGADTFLGSNFLRQLLGSQLEIWTVVNSQKGLEAHPHLKVFSLAQDWLSALPEKIDYFVDFLNFSDSCRIAQEKNSRLLSVVDQEQKGLVLDKEENGLDWRLAKTSFVFGPTEKLEELTFLNKVLLKAVLNEKITLPFSELGHIYPLYITDCCNFLEQALFSPAMEKKEMLLVGKKVSWQRFLDYLEKRSQFTNGIRVDTDLVLPEINSAKENELKEDFGWEPLVSWKKGVDKTLQYFFQKKEKKELDFAPKEFLPKKEESKKEEKEYFKPRVVSTKLPKPKKLLKKKKRDPSLAIDQNFWDQEPEQALPLPLSPIIVKARWQEEEVKTEPKQEVVKIPALEEKAPKQFKKRRVSWLIPAFALMLLGYLFTPFLAGGFYLGLAYFQLAGGLKNSQNYLWKEAGAQAQKAELYFDQVFSFWQAGLGQKGLSLAQSGKKASSVLSQAGALADLGLELNRALWQGEGDAFLVGDKIRIQEEALSRRVNLLSAELAGGGNNFNFLIKRSNLIDWQEKIAKAQEILAKSEKMLVGFDWWLGQKEPRRILIVFQNNMELRPTGGFIGSLAILEVSNGKISQFKVEDVYTVDGQLAGHVEPPLVLKNILGESGWYLRDSNWSPDFPTSAEKISWFYQKETGASVDAVISLNLDSARKILSQIGEVYLADYNEKINADNLFAKAEFYSETNFFPGSTQKASFLSALAGQILAVTQNTPDQVAYPLAQAVLDSLEEKEILISTTDPEINQALQANNWDGRIKSVTLGKQSSFSDYLFLVEANLGVNKANYFLRRSLNLLIDPSQEKINHVLQINYENTSQSTSWPGGEYKNYLRLFLPLGTSIDRVIIYDPLKGKEDSQKIIVRDELDQEREKEKLVLGFLVEVPINSRRVVEVEYSQKINLPQDGWHYLLYLQKQSGMGNSPLKVAIILPEGFKPLQTSRPAVLDQEALIFEGLFTSDWPLALELSR